MKPETHALSGLFGSDVRYVVPLYQRPYVWKESTHWEPLWQDILEILEQKQSGSEHTSSHFLGAVVLDQEDTPPGEATRRLVIDGQQRLTTLQLLLTAAAEEAEQAGAEKEGRLLRRLTRNSEDLTEGDGRFKVWPTNANQAAFRSVMDVDGQGVGPDDPSNTVHEAHAFFRRTIRAWSRDGRPGQEDLVDKFDALRVVLSSLIFVVSINLEAGDNAQVIFETLNARGTPLLAMDLVKNAVVYKASLAKLDTDTLHDQVWQPQLGDEYWRVSKRQGRLNRPRAELFLMHWLAMKLGRVVPATELFSEFRAHVLDKTNPAAIGDLVEELCRDAATMRSFDSQAIGSTEERFFRHLEALDTTTVLPVVLLLFRDKELTPERRRRALTALESWLTRRMLVGLTTKNYNRSSGELLEVLGNGAADADERIIGHLASSDAVTQHWPRNRELTRLLVSRRLYGWVKQTRIVMVLAALEVHRRRASHKTEDVYTLPPKLTIEHVMPQKSKASWPLPEPEELETDEELIERRKALIHRLGNLTLTSGSLNSALSNGPWTSKRSELHANSLLLLNAELSALDVWDERSIQVRGHELALEICRVWPGPGELGYEDQEQEVTLVEAGAADAPVGGTEDSEGSSYVSVKDLVDAGFLDEGETLQAKRQRVSDTAVVLGDGGLSVADSSTTRPRELRRRRAATRRTGGVSGLLSAAMSCCR